MKKISRTEKILFPLLVALLPAQIGKHFWPPQAYVRGIRIDYLSPTIFLTDIIILSLPIFCFARHNWSEKVKLLKNGKTLGFAALVFLAILINIVVSNNPSVTIYSWLRIAELAILFFFLTSAPRKIIHSLKNLLPIPVIYSSLIAISQFLKQASVGGLLYWLGERTFTISTPGIAKTDIFGRLALRPYATFPHPNALAGFILVCLTLLTPLLLTKRKKGKYTLTLLPPTFILGLLTLVLTFSLSAWVAAILLTTLLLSSKYKGKILPTIFFLAAILVILISSFPPEKQSIESRLAIAKTSLEMTKQNPFIGVGLGNFIPNLAKFDQGNVTFSSPFLYYQPVHSIYLLLLAETGAIGLFAFLWLFLKALKDSKQTQRFELTLALLGILLTGIVDHYWLTLQQTRLLFTGVLALALR